MMAPRREASRLPASPILLQVPPQEDAPLDVVRLARQVGDWDRAIDDVERAMAGDLAGVGAELAAEQPAVGDDLLPVGIRRSARIDLGHLEEADGDPDREDVRGALHAVTNVDQRLIAEATVPVDVVP